ncbi:MAG: metallophosphoesterase [Treponema sp.]|nr:metallophosphoesterase [Treponema sp.]
MKKLLSPAIAIAFLLCLCAIMAGCGEADTEEDSVTSIRLRYNGAVIPNNSLTVNLSEGELAFTAEVEATGGASKDFTLESSVPAVAAVSGKTVALLAGGQTRITATAAADTSKTHAITLNVWDDREFTVTVTGGSADKETAFFSQTVTLTPATQAGKVFTDWTIDPPAVVMLSPNQFRMPASDVTVTGNFEDTGSDAGKPYNITNNFGEDSSTEFLAQWHNDSSITTQSLQVVTAAGSFADAVEIPAETEAFQTSGTIGNFPLRNIFRVHITGLSPATMYKYRMGTEGTWSKVFYYTTSGGPNTDFSFTVVSDPQNATHTEMISTLRKANDFDSDNRFFLLCGDLVEQIGQNPGEIVSYTNAANEFNTLTPIAATQGNHDTYPAAGGYDIIVGESTIFNGFVTFPANGCEPDPTRSQSYYFYYNNVLFIMLNTLVTGTQHPVQVNWLREILDNDRAKGLSKYTIVATHMGAFGNHYYEDYWIKLTRETYGRLFSDYGVDIVFSGHDHTYARTNPIKIGSDSTISVIDFEPTPGGTIYSIAASTGPKNYGSATGSTPYLAASFKVMTTKGEDIMPGMFVNVKVTGEKLTVTAMRRDDYKWDEYEVPAKR